MKYNLILALCLLFLVSCGNDNDDNNRFGINALGQQCSLNQINGFNNFNNFNNGYQYGAYNPYQLEMARRCGYAINNNFNNGGFNNGFNNGINNGGCFVPQDLQHMADYDRIDADMIADLNYEIENELRDVHGIVQPQSEADVAAYYTQVGFSAGVNTGGGFGYGNPYGFGGGFGGNPWGYCDQIGM